MIYSRKTKVPVLLIIYNRPQYTKKILKSINKYGPSILYIAADGWKDKEDRYKCLSARNQTNHFKWGCPIETVFRKKNLGCGKAVSKAITWFFKNNTKGIILEDDCLPNEDFYYYCDQMLNRYEYNGKIMHISGVNYLPNKLKKRNGYYFSKMTHVWGWATWRRAWRKYDYKMTRWGTSITKNTFSNNYDVLHERNYWSSIFDIVKKRKIDTWDYQWLYSCWVNEGLSINPGVNLVKNIGIEKDGTHTKNKINGIENKLEKFSYPLKNPSVVARDINRDRYVIENIFRPKFYSSLYLKIRYFL